MADFINGSYFLLFIISTSKQRDTLLNSLKKGQKVVTIGGMYGEIISLDDETVVLLVADKVEIKFARSSIASIVTKHKEAK